MGELNKRDELDGILTLQQVLDEEEEIHAESPFGKENIRPGAESRSSDHLESPSRRHSKTLVCDFRLRIEGVPERATIQGTDGDISKVEGSVISGLTLNLFETCHLERNLC